MESISARDLDRRLADLVRSERNLVVQFVVELAGFAKRELYRELGYTSLWLSIRALVELREVLTEETMPRCSSGPRASRKRRPSSSPSSTSPSPSRGTSFGHCPCRQLHSSRSPRFPRELKRLLRRPRSSGRSRRNSAASTSRSRQTSSPNWSKSVPRSLTTAPTATSNRSC